MASQLDDDRFETEERFARLRLMVAESEKFSAETRRIVADMTKAQAEVKILPWSTIFQAMLATAALLGAGAAIARLFAL